MPMQCKRDVHAMEQTIAEYGNIAIAGLKTLCGKEISVLAPSSECHERVAITRRRCQVGEFDYCVIRVNDGLTRVLAFQCLKKLRNSYYRQFGVDRVCGPPLFLLRPLLLFRLFELFRLCGNATQEGIRETSTRHSYCYLPITAGLINPIRAPINPP